MRDDLIYDCYTMNQFMKQCQHLYHKLESWEEYTDTSLIVRTIDGYDYFYDAVYEGGLARRIKRIYDTNDINDLTEEEWRKSFSYFLDREIRRIGIPRYELAEQIDITVSMLSRYLNCKATPSGPVIQKLAYALDCDVNDILPHDFVPIYYKDK